MRKRLFSPALALALMILTAAPALAQTPLFQITTTHLPPPKAGQAYTAQLTAIGGTPPYHWSLAGGTLPAGLTFHAGSGRITGTPASADAFSILVAVSDSSNPALIVTRLLPATAAAPLSLAWDLPPAVSGDAITGTVNVGNATDETLDVTAITVAVNQIGKAFTLGYAQQTLNPGGTLDGLAFGSTLPPGTYTVHTDVVAVASASVIYRQRLEKPGLVVPQAWPQG